MTTQLDPVVVSVEVGLPPEEAFKHFTEEMDSWWPTERHSIGEDNVEAIVVDGGAGGRVFERWRDGTTKDWADILEWDPPHRLRMAWHPNETGLSTDVEVTFSPTTTTTATGTGTGTRVELTHRGWETLGADAVPARESYATGWIGVLELFAA